jgi:predicted transcriptional regulator
MPIDVETLLQDRGTPLCIQAETTIQSALDIMIDNDYSQLPVVDSTGNLIGLISEQIITREYYVLSKTTSRTGPSVNLLDKTVRECMLEAETLEPEGSLVEVISRLENAYSIVIIEGKRPIGIITTYDVMNYLHGHFESFMDIEEIELELRKLTTDVLSDDLGRSTALISAFGEAKQDPTKPGKLHTGLTLGEQINFMCHKHNWTYFRDYVGPPDLFEAFMGQVKDVRNQLAHYRGSATAVQRANVKFALRWLRARPKPPKSTVVSTAHTPEAVSPPQNVRHSGKYAPLQTWLEDYSAPDESIKLSFPEVEVVLGSQLPPMASERRSWWANVSEEWGRSQSRAWLRAGWRVADVDLEAKEVTFARISNAKNVDNSAIE